MFEKKSQKKLETWSLQKWRWKEEYFIFEVSSNDICLNKNELKIITTTTETIWRKKSIYEIYLYRKQSTLPPHPFFFNSKLNVFF